MLNNRTDLIHFLRDHIVGAMHVGHIQPGDRLPSIRALAARLGKNPRTVKAAYEALEHEGIVEVRGRSGVFLAPQELVGGEVSEETARWLSGVIAEAWKRRIPVTALADEVQRFTCARRIRCALVDCVEDAIVALGHELKTDWGFDLEVVSPDLVESAKDVDFFAATAFFAPLIRADVERLGKPLVVLTIHAALQQAIRQAVARGQLTVVAADPRFGDRIRVSYSPDEPERIRQVLARDGEAVAGLDPDEPVLLTRAARLILESAPAPTIYPYSPTLSAETARGLAEVVVRMNVTGRSAAS